MDSSLISSPWAKYQGRAFLKPETGPITVEAHRHAAQRIPIVSANASNERKRAIRLIL